MTTTNPIKITPEEWRTAAKVARRSIFGNSELAEAWENVAKYSAAADLPTQLAKAIRAAWVDRLDWDELAHAALKLLTSTGRLVSAGGMALTAEQVEDVRAVVDSFAGMDPEFPSVQAAHRLRALFPATEPAEDGRGDVNPNDPQGRTYRETAEEYYATPVTERKCRGYCNSTDATLLRSCTNCGAIEDDPWGKTKPAEEPRCTICNLSESEGRHFDYDHPFTTELGPFDDEGNERTTPVPVEPAEEETKAEGPCEVRSPQGDPCSFPKPGHAGVHTWAWPDKKPAGEGTRAECVGDDYYCAQRDSAGNIRLNCGRGLLVAEAACTVNDVKEWWARADRGSKWERQYQAALDLFDREAAASPVTPAPTVVRERCHDCSCHINPPCGRCVECKHVDYPDCENDCQDCEDHQETPAQAPAHKTTCTDGLVRGQRGTIATCTCGWRDAWGMQDGSAEASAHAHGKTHSTKENDA